MVNIYIQKQFMYVEYYILKDDNKKKMAKGCYTPRVSSTILLKNILRIFDKMINEFRYSKLSRKS